VLDYILRRVTGFFPVLFVIVSLSFFMMRLAPGGPFDQERALPEQVRANIEARYHLESLCGASTSGTSATLRRAIWAPPSAIPTVRSSSRWLTLPGLASFQLPIWSYLV
jgi:hypothetical protein